MFPVWTAATLYRMPETSTRSSNPSGGTSRPLSGPHPGCRPELLAPAGDWECARAAVENGADAIYFGLDQFNARMRADNFTETDLPGLMAFLHLRGVRGYVTVNTLVFEDELADAERYLRAVIAAGVDAAIVQDVGICRLIRQLSLDFPIHASTQMTITSAAGVEFARDLGCNLVVLARECSLREIGLIQEAQRARAGTDGQTHPDDPVLAHRASPDLPLPLEVFVHGALCVAYSGQCLTSESLGGRSANRGECAQACRMPYDLISDGMQIPLGDRRYLLSPQDLAGIDLLPELASLGVASLKIEGRLKAPEYVANITRLYREALDQLQPVRPPTGSGRVEIEDASSAATQSISPANLYSMEMAFSRGLSTGWFGGIDNQELVHARFGKKRGVYLGEVVRVLHDSAIVDLEMRLKPGDGVVFDAGRPDETEEGGRVYEMRGVEPGPRIRDDEDPRGEYVELAFGRGHIDFSRIRVGNKLWKTSDPELEKRWRQSFEGRTPRFTRPLSLEVHGLAGTPLTLLARDELGHVARASSAMGLVPAVKQPLTTERLIDQLGRLGGTPFRLGGLENHLEGGVILPVSELNRLRRDVVAELELQRSRPKRWRLEIQSAEDRRTDRGTTTPERADPKLIVLVRSLPQLEAALACGTTTVYCEFENPKKYREAVPLFRSVFGPVSADPGRPAIFVAPPRIFKPGEEWTLEQVRSSEADGYLVRNCDHLRFLATDRKIGDFSLNVANRLSADYFRSTFGLERVTASYDLNFQQLEALLQGAPPEWFEITIHQHMPMFHMEHCVFCAFLTTGKDYRDCGRPCDVHDVRLRDRVGAEHPLKADAGCRNTVFNSQAQTGAEYVERMQTLGVRYFRIEFLNETPGEVGAAIVKYRQLLRGEVTGAQLWRELKLRNQLGVTRGQMAGTRR